MKETNNIIIKLTNYLEQNLITSPNLFYKENVHFAESCFNKKSSKNLDNYLEQKLDKNNFQQTLFKLIDKNNKKDSEIYNKAYIDRRLFSKIRTDENYHPTKHTIISLGLALELNITDFENLLKSASYSLPKNNYFDLIIRFCIEEKIYDIIEVNYLLDKYNCNTL